MGRVAVVLTFDEPEGDIAIGEKLEELRTKIFPHLEGLGNGRVWVGIQEAAEEIMRVTKEID